MPDMLVKLYDLDFGWADEIQAKKGVTIRKPLAPERRYVIDWVMDVAGYSARWADEVATAMAHTPYTCFIATKDEELVGFAVYDSVALGFFGPTGVLPEDQHQGIGTALMLSCFREMKMRGYGYAVVGGVGPQAYYEKTVNAIVIPDSWPGVYKGMLTLRDKVDWDSQRQRWVRKQT